MKNFDATNIKICMIAAFVFGLALGIAGAMITLLASLT